MQTLVKTQDNDYIFSSNIHITCFREKMHYLDDNNKLLDTSQYDTIYVDKSSTQNNTVIIADNITNILSNVDNAINELLQKLTYPSNIVNKYNDTSVWQICATGDHESIVSDLKGHPEYKFFILNDHFIPAKPSDFKDSTGFDKINDELYKIYNEKIGYHRLAWYKYNHTEPQGTVTLQNALYNSGYGNLLPKSNIQVYTNSTWQVISFADYAGLNGAGWKMDINTSSDYTPLIVLGPNDENNKTYIGGSDLIGKENYIVPYSESIKMEDTSPVVPKYWRIQSYDSQENHSSGSPYGFYMPSNIINDNNITELLSILSVTYADIDVLDYFKLAIITVAKAHPAYNKFQYYLHIPHVGKFFHGYTNPKDGVIGLFRGRSPFSNGDPSPGDGRHTRGHGDCYRKQLKLSVLVLSKDGKSTKVESKQYSEDHTHLVFKFVQPNLITVPISLNGIYISKMKNISSYQRHKFSEKYLARTWTNTHSSGHGNDSCDISTDPSSDIKALTQNKPCQDQTDANGKSICERRSDGTVWAQTADKGIQQIDCNAKYEGGWGFRCKQSCQNCWWATSNGIDCGAFAERIECACSRCDGFPKGQRYTWDTYARQNYWFIDPNNVTYGSDQTICNVICGNTFNKEYKGYCSHPESINREKCCSCSLNNHYRSANISANPVSWDQPVQGGECKDLISNCDMHMKNGGCLDANKDHDSWRTKCVNTCGYCSDSRYNPHAK